MEFLDNKPSEQKEQDLTPLINIVFLILIFFMVSAAIAPKSDNAIEPIRSSVISKELALPSMAVTIDKDGAIFENGKRLQHAEYKKRLAQLSITADSAISVKADARLDASLLIELLSIATDAGVASASIMTLRP